MVAAVPKRSWTTSVPSPVAGVPLPFSFFPILLLYKRVRVFGHVAVDTLPVQGDEGEEDVPGLGDGVFVAEPVDALVESREGAETEPGLDYLLDEPVGLRLRFVLAASFLAFEDVVLGELAQADEGELGGVLALEGADARL